MLPYEWWASQVALLLKNPPVNAGDAGLIPVSGRSTGEGNGNPFQYSCLGNPMDGRAGWAAKSWTRLSDITHSYFTMLC